MTVYYLWSGATGTGDGSSWANAFTTLNTATTGAIAHMVGGDTLYVAHDHAEAGYTSSQTFTFPGSSTAFSYVMVVNRAGSVPPVEADIITTPTVDIKTVGTFSITINGFAYVSGMRFVAGATSTSGGNLTIGEGSNTPTHTKFRDCAFIVATTSGSATVGFLVGNRGNSLSQVDFLSNCQLGFGATGQSLIVVQGVFNWYNSPTPFVTGANTYTSGNFQIPNIFIRETGNTQDRYACVLLDGVDLSSITGTIASNQSGGGNIMNYEFRNCNLAASPTRSGPWGTNDTLNKGQILYSDCNNSNNYDNSAHYAVGNITTESTIKPISGSASDGTNTFTWKMVSSTNCSVLQPLPSFEFIEWNDSPGTAVTRTLDVITDNVTLTNADFYVKAEYLGSSSSPLSSFISSGPSTVLGTGTNLTSSSTTWTTTGLTTPITQQTSLTFTPQMKGYIHYTAYLTKPSTTVYLNPIMR